MSFPRLLILEGPDRTGKTSLGKYLARVTGAVFLHQTYLGQNDHRGVTCEVYHDNVLENVETNLELGKTVILDRHWPSEMIYGMVMGRNISGFDWSRKHERIRKMGGVYIICESVECIQRFKDENKSERTLEQFMSIVHQYEQFEDIFGIDTLRYDLESMGHDLAAFHQLLELTP